VRNNVEATEKPDQAAEKSYKVTPIKCPALNYQPLSAMNLNEPHGVPSNIYYAQKSSYMGALPRMMQLQN